MTAPPNLENEKDLLISIIAGNMDSFETMLHYYEKPIWNHLRRITGNNDNASDLLQETFLKVYRNRKRIAPENNFKNWVYRIATNTAYDFLRKKRHIIEISLYANEGSETILPELAYSRIEEEILAHDMEKALEQVPLHYRTILLLYYREGFSYEETALILGLTLNTVKTQLRRAKQALSKHLHNYE